MKVWGSLCWRHFADPHTFWVVLLINAVLSYPDAHSVPLEAAAENGIWPAYHHPQSSPVLLFPCPSQHHLFIFLYLLPLFAPLTHCCTPFSYFEKVLLTFHKVAPQMGHHHTEVPDCSSRLLLLKIHCY